MKFKISFDTWGDMWFFIPTIGKDTPFKGKVEIAIIWLNWQLAITFY